MQTTLKLRRSKFSETNGKIWLTLGQKNPLIHYGPMASDFGNVQFQQSELSASSNISTITTTYFYRCTENSNELTDLTHCLSDQSEKTKNGQTRKLEQMSSKFIPKNKKFRFSKWPSPAESCEGSTGRTLLFRLRNFVRLAWYFHENLIKLMWVLY